MQIFPTELLKEWFLAHRRSLPWRENNTPYRVWISEVMLQQTQVLVVIPYFERWMRAFPTIEALANAPTETVLKCWEGLGYYSRARNLHIAAGYILKHFGGSLPSSCQELSQIKGIGPYTQGAIRSFAFRQKAVAVDGNVLRVLSRFLAFQEEIDLPKSKAYLQEYAERLLPDEEPWLVSEGLIELGATVCSKKAKCEICPLQKSCLAHRHHLETILPKKRATFKTIHLTRIVGVIYYKNFYLLKKGEEGKVMADLHEFPYLESQNQECIAKRFSDHFDLPMTYLKPLPPQEHTFTRYKARLFPHLLEAKSMNEKYLWKREDELVDLPFSSGHKRILNHLLTNL